MPNLNHHVIKQPFLAFPLPASPAAGPSRQEEEKIKTA